MPIPKPKKDEKQKEFHSRCMSVIFDEYGLEQGNAVCYDAWRDSKKENKMKNLKEADTFKCPECDSKVLVNTGYCLKCKKKVKESKIKEEGFENILRDGAWPIITIGFIAEFDDDYEDVISEAKMYLQEYYGFEFDNYKDVVYTDESAQTIEVANPIDWDQIQRLINNAEWIDSETIYLSDIQTNIMFVDREGNSMSIDLLSESKKEIKTNTILEKSHGITVILNEEEKLKVGDRVIMSNSGLMMYSNKYKDKEYIIKDIIADHGFNTFDIGLPFRVEVLDVVKVEESKEETFILRDNVRIGRIILEKDERIKIIKKLKGI